MARVTSNLASVVLGIKRLDDAISFRAPGLHRGRLGLDVIDTVVTGIQAQTIERQLQPDGAPLAPLKRATIRRKQRLGYSEKILIETGQMLSRPELTGQFSITRNTIQLTYGKSPLAIKKAEWATEGSRKRRRRKRPFFDLNKQTRLDLDVVVFAGLDKNARKAGAV